jgi:hypothetical protein
MLLILKISKKRFDLYKLIERNRTDLIFNSQSLGGHTKNLCIISGE